MRRLGDLSTFLWAGALLLVTCSVAQGALVHFSHTAPGAEAVYLTGDFNSWQPETIALSGPDDEGVWSVDLEMPKGTYLYKFIVDGTRIHDPENPGKIDDRTGGFNSVLVIPEGAGRVVTGGGGLHNAAR